MEIAVIGTGNVGGALATRWAAAGHRILLGTKDTSNFKGKPLLENPNTSVHTIAEAIAEARVALVATPPQIATDLVKTMGNLQGKVLIDATNAVRTRPAPYPTAYHAFAALSEAQVVKCFNTTGFENMLDPQYGDQALDMFMAGDSDEAKSLAAQLAADAGFAACHDFGKADRVELLEQFALSWINLAIFQGMGRNIGFKLLKR